MGIYPVGTPTVFEMPGLLPNGVVYRYPQDFPYKIVGSPDVHGQGDVYRTEPTGKPALGRRWVWLTGVGRNALGGTWQNFPAFGITEVGVNPADTVGHPAFNASGTTATTTLMVPPTTDQFHTPFPAGGTMPTYIEFANVNYPFYYVTGNWHPQDFGTVAVMSMRYANAIDASVPPIPPEAPALPWTGPFQIDCGSGPNRCLILEYWMYGGNSGDTNYARVNAVTDTPNIPPAMNTTAYRSSQIQPPPTITAPGQSTPQYYALRTLKFRKRYLLNPPVGVANLLFQWSNAPRGFVAAHCYAGVAQVDPPITQTFRWDGDVPGFALEQSHLELDTNNPDTYSGTPGVNPNCPEGAYWFSEIATYGRVNLGATNDGSGDQEFANLEETWGVMSIALQRGPGTGAPVVTSWGLEPPSRAMIETCFLRWDQSTEAPEPRTLGQVNILG